METGLVTTIAAAPNTIVSLPTSRPLVRASAVLLISGIGFVGEAIFAPDLLRWFYELVASPETVTDMSAAARLGAALFGALTFGWGVTLLQAGRGVSLVKAATAGVVAWFVVDSLASLALGYAWNALSNAGFLVVLLLLLRERSSR